jgi:O-antigen ligase/tetratricopeptide (TPR) repeat protein
LALFTLLVAAQLLPLPPSILRAISPQTFETYRQILPGWPERAPYGELASMEQGAGSTEQDGSKKQSAESEAQEPEVGNQSPVSSLQSVSNMADAKNAEDPENALNAGPIENPNSKIQNRRALLPQTWLPLSLSPNLGRIDLLRFVAFAALFFLVWRYPFEKPFEDFEPRTSNSAFFILSPEQRFLRLVIFGVLGTGLLLAGFGFVERFAWNGKILLFIAGYSSGLDDVARSSGPFINPDHFANYLSLILPLAIAAALFRTFMVPRSQQYGLSIFCAFTGFLLFTGILLSLSRAGWIATLFGIVVLVWLAPWGGAAARGQARSREQGARSRSGHSSSVSPRQSSAARSQASASGSKLNRAARLSAITVCLLLIVSLFIAGESGREQVDLRLEETVSRDIGLAGRATAWRDTLGMIRDYPLIGVGLGAWQDVFNRYESGPWSSEYFNEAHNDYIEILAETGVLGFVLLASFVAVAGRRMTKAVKRVSSKDVPLLAGILSAMAVMTLHSFLDFSLQIPANALLFTVLLALGMRLARSREPDAWSPVAALPSNASINLEQVAWSDLSQSVRGEELGARRDDAKNAQRDSAINPLRFALSPLRRVTPYFVSALALALIGCAVTQEEEPRSPESVAEAAERLLARPVKASYHLSVIRRVRDNAPLEWQLREYQAALWIQPTNPYIRDQIATTLKEMGRTEEALKEISLSVAHAPSLKRHEYLSAESLPELLPEEQDAVERGFKQAVAWNYPEAFTGLADFYEKLERFADQAMLYEEVAAKETDAARKAELLVQSGRAYVKAESVEQGAESQAQSVPREQRSDVSHATNAERGHASRLTPHGASAERLFRAAIAATPADPKPYQYLLRIFAQREDLELAKELVATGIKNGAPALPLYLSLAESAHKVGVKEESAAAFTRAKDEVEKLIGQGYGAYTLYMQLADGARRAGDRDAEAEALLKALDRQGRSSETLMRLADVYGAKRNYDRAALYLHRVANIEPASAEVFYRIGRAEEARYRFVAAGRAYARAVELAPSDERYQERYAAFRERVAANATERDAQSAKR